MALGVVDGAAARLAVVRSEPGCGAVGGRGATQAAVRADAQVARRPATRESEVAATTRARRPRSCRRRARARCVRVGPQTGLRRLVSFRVRSGRIWTILHHSGSIASNLQVRPALRGDSAGLGDSGSTRRGQPCDAGQGLRLVLLGGLVPVRLRGLPAVLVQTQPPVARDGQLGPVDLALDPQVGAQLLDEGRLAVDEELRPRPGGNAAALTWSTSRAPTRRSSRCSQTDVDARRRLDRLLVRRVRPPR